MIFSVIFAGVALKLEKVGPTKNPCFDLFIHWLINQITLTETIFLGHTKIALSISYTCTKPAHSHASVTEILLSSRGMVTI